MSPRGPGLVCLLAALTALGCDDDPGAEADAAPPVADAADDPAPPDAGPPDAAADASPDPADAAPDAAPGAHAALRAAMQAALDGAPDGVGGMTLLVFDAADTRVVDVSVGDSAADRRMPVASASKMIAGLVFLRLVEEGALSLDSTPGALLGWQGPFADATLDMLNAFTSGMPGDALCTNVVRTTLQRCVENMEGLDPLGAPGQVYDYGPTHQHVAAAMAEAVTGEPWSALFERTLKAPLGLDDPALVYTTRPRSAEGTDNPLIAGGLIATPEEYARMLSVVFHRGEVDGESFIAPALVDRMGENHYPEARVQGSPAQSYGFDYYYGFASWLECDGPVASCDVISSPGAFGFTPWVDWGRRYYALLAMDRGSFGGAEFSMRTVDELVPLIDEALGR